MTALRPERDSSPYGGEAAYGGADAFEGAEAFGDPLTGSAPPPPVQQEWYAPQGTGGHTGDWHGATYEDPAAAPSQEPYQVPYEASAPYEAPYEEPDEQPVAAPRLPDDETVALRIPDAPGLAERAARAAASESIPAPGGRAARRKAARRHGRHGGAPEAAEKAPEAPAGAPRTRMEARRAARAQKPGVAVVVSRVIGEVFITTGVLMLLFVTYQLWWSNVRAHQQAGSEAHHLQEDWANGKRQPGAFAPGQGFAILHIPKLDVVAPIAEGTNKTKVLDRGMVGHYGEGATKTAMPDAKAGNFGLAGHRNTHGEPFRYINRLKPGDAIVVETQDAYYVYKMASILPVTSPSNTSVLNAIPKGSGFTTAGRYITLTTCTPEFTSKYRMIVWGKMVEERPRSKGKPDALVE